MKKVSRREFLRSATALGTAAIADPSHLFSFNHHRQGENLQDRLFNSELPFDYDSDCFEAAERIFFEEHNRAVLNLFIKPAQSLDVRLYIADARNGLYRKNPMRWSGLSDCIDIPLGKVLSSELHYKVEYRAGKSWKSLEERSVKTPNIDLDRGGVFKVILIGDDHLSADLKIEPEDEAWRRDILRGDYIRNMLRKIIEDPDYRPDISVNKKMIGFSYAWTLKYILENKPDLVIDLGDTVGPDWYRIWGTEGRWPELQPENNLAVQSKILWERKRRTLSPISPEVPYYLVLGNHDGEVGWFTESQPITQPYAREQRKRLLKQPEALRFFEKVGLNSVSIGSRFTNDGWLFKNPDQNYFPIFWANGDVRFFVLDVNSYLLTKPRTIYDWALGPKQKHHIEAMLFDGQDVPWKFICFHNTVGGYPLGSGVSQGAYGRGPLFTREDYERINKIDPNVQVDPDRVEQVWLTDLARESELRGFLYGHDHVFFNKDIGRTAQGKEMIGTCVGSTNYSSGNLVETMWGNPYWMDFYGPWYEDPPGFVTPPGITEMVIDKSGATIRYICTAPVAGEYNNMPEGIKPGDVVREYRISR